MNPVEQRMAMAYEARGYGYGMNPMQQRMGMGGDLSGFGGRGFGGAGFGEQASIMGGKPYAEQHRYDQQQYDAVFGQNGRSMGRGLGGGIGGGFQGGIGGGMGNGMNPGPLGLRYILGGAKNMLQGVSSWRLSVETWSNRLTC
jgi:hypothetical protein